MKPTLSCAILAVGCLVLPPLLPALTIIECVDSDGNWSYRDICPPGMTVKSKKIVNREPEPEVAPTIEEIAKANPVRLFVAPNCNACDLVRNLLAGRKVPFTEKDASQDPEIQAELSALTDGPLTVPTVAIGEQKFTGYHKSELDSALTGVGFP